MTIATPPDTGHLDKRATKTIAISAKRAAQYFPDLAPLTNGWYRIRENDRPTLNVAILDNLDCHRFPLLHPTSTTVTNDALKVWQLITGSAWFGTPGTAGSDVLEPMLKAVKPRGATFKPKDPGPDNDEKSVEQPYYPRDWHRTEDHARYVFGYDVTRMYLAAAINAEVAPWSLKHTGRTSFDPKLAGWWLIEVPPWNESRLPDPAGYGPRVRWVTTPTAKLLWQLGEQGLSAGITVVDSWTGPGNRLFRKWGELMEDGYQKSKAVGSDLLSTAFKQSARETMGLFNARSYTTYRPDWWFTIVATARTNLWRKVRLVADTEGRWPLSVATDNVRYASPVPDPVAGCPAKLILGDRLGQFKVKAAGR